MPKQHLIFKICPIPYPLILPSQIEYPQQLNSKFIMSLTMSILNIFIYDFVINSLSTKWSNLTSEFGILYFHITHLLIL